MGKRCNRTVVQREPPKPGSASIHATEQSASRSRQDRATARSDKHYGVDGIGRDPGGSPLETSVGTEIDVALLISGDDRPVIRQEIDAPHTGLREYSCPAPGGVTAVHAGLGGRKCDRLWAVPNNEVVHGIPGQSVHLPTRSRAAAGPHKSRMDH